MKKKPTQTEMDFTPPIGWRVKWEERKVLGRDYFSRELRIDEHFTTRTCKPCTKTQADDLIRYLKGMRYVKNIELINPQ